MTLQLIYGDRIGSTNHDMGCIKESFFFFKRLYATLLSIR